MTNPPATTGESRQGQLPDSTRRDGLVWDEPFASTTVRGGAGRPRPFVKWAGGKSQLLGALRSRLPAWLTTPARTTLTTALTNLTGRACSPVYHEPFAGGGALFFDLCPQAARLGDLNADLIATYLAVRDHVEILIRRLAELAPYTDALSYQAVRDDWPTPDPANTVERAARLIYLNKLCYNGLYRVNRHGQFNVPYGRHKSPTVCDPDNLRACAAALAHATIEVAPYETVLDHANSGDVVYFDPPYQPVSATANFTAYARGGFDETHQRRLAEVFTALDARGCWVLLSNSDTPLIHELYAGFEIARVTARRAINSAANKRGRIAEVLVRNRRAAAAPPPPLSGGS